MFSRYQGCKFSIIFNNCAKKHIKIFLIIIHVEQIGFMLHLAYLWNLKLRNYDNDTKYPSG